MVAAKWALTVLYCIIIIVIIMTAVVEHRVQSAHTQQQQQKTLGLLIKDRHNFQVDRDLEGKWNRKTK